MTDPMSPTDLIEKLHWRYAVKKFDATKQIPADLWQTLEEVLVLSPSSYGFQAWKFIDVIDPVLRKKLLAAGYNQSQIVEASHLVVFAVKKDYNTVDLNRYIDRIAEIRNVPKDSLAVYRGMMQGSIDGATKTNFINEWMTRQVYIALGNFLTSCAVLGIDACPMEGFQAEAFDTVLGLDKKQLHAVVLATVGYRAPEDGYAHVKKVRFPMSDIIERV